jgi:adenylate kinase
MEKTLNIILFGPPGAGKGTQSENLINKYGLVHLSTGNILRSEIERGTDLGRKAKDVISRGELVADEIVIGMIESKIDESPDTKGFIFDGFPRTTEQALALDDLLQKKGLGISAMIALEVDDEELVKRLLLRGKDSGRPDDSNEEIINKRIEVYNRETLPLKEFYSEQAKFHSVDGIGSVEEIFKSLTDRITFLNAEMDLTALENDFEHLDLTIQDFDEANDIAPELLLEIDAIKRAEAEEEAEEADNRKQDRKKSASSEQENSKNKKTVLTRNIPKKKVVKKAIAKKASVKKVAKKAIVKKAIVRNAVAKKAIKKSIKKSVKKVAAKKLSLKKVVKKEVIKKAAKKAVKKLLVKKLSKKSPSKKIAIKKIVKKAVKKGIKKASPKKASKKIPIKKSVKKSANKKRR